MATAYTLEFEKPLQELDRQIEELRRSSTERGTIPMPAPDATHATIA